MSPANTTEKPPLPFSSLRKFYGSTGCFSMFIDSCYNIGYIRNICILTVMLKAYTVFFKAKQTLKMLIENFPLEGTHL